MVSFITRKSIFATFYLLLITASLVLCDDDDEDLVPSVNKAFNGRVNFVEKLKNKEQVERMAQDAMGEPVELRLVRQSKDE